LRDYEEAPDDRTGEIISMNLDIMILSETLLLEDYEAQLCERGKQSCKEMLGLSRLLPKTCTPSRTSSATRNQKAKVSPCTSRPPQLSFKTSRKGKISCPEGIPGLFILEFSEIGALYYTILIEIIHQ